MSMSQGAVTKQRCYMRADLTAKASRAINIIERDTPAAAEPSTGQPLSASVEIPTVASSSAAEPLNEDQKLAISTVFAEELAKKSHLREGAKEGIPVTSG